MSKREKTHHELFASQVQSFAQLALKSMTGSVALFQHWKMKKNKISIVIPGILGW